MTLEPIQYLLGAISGGLVGFVLGLVGGGGSILAVPLIVYPGWRARSTCSDRHSALAVAANAAMGLISHWRIGNVKWRCATVFALTGIAELPLGRRLARHSTEQKLLFFFALVMIVVGVLMLRRRGHIGNPEVKLARENAGKLTLFGYGTGLFSVSSASAVAS